VAEILENPSGSARIGRRLCADVSQQHSEPLGATASRVDTWLLVEYRRLWSRDPIAGSGLADEVKHHLRAQLRALPSSRLLFIRRPDRRQQDSLAVFFGRSREREQSLFSLVLSDYEQLLSLDFVAALTGAAQLGARLTHPLLVVCTHGKRDRCCAKYGRPLYDELRKDAEPDWVWQSTHVGGDRFAGNLVCLPEGLYFGRVEPADVSPLLDQYLAGRIDLEHYRGRSCYPFAAQAAEQRVRAETGLTGVDDVSLAGSERTGDDSWRVRFLVAATGELHETDVAGELADEPAYLTCSAATPSRPRRYVATAHRVLPRR
jgi:hypothetical protein